MKTLLLLFTFIGLMRTAEAQHCSLDGSNAIIVEVRDSLTNKIVDGLTLTLCDSTGVPYISEWNLFNFGHLDFNVQNDTLIFGQNKIKARAKSTITGPYGFARNCYMLEVYANNYPEFNRHGKDEIRIVDKKGRYQSAIAHFTSAQIASLCTDAQWKYEKDGIANHKITVYLNPID